MENNGNEYRNIQIQRTLLYIEQSIKDALSAFTFAANDAGTWTTVVARISSFLQGVWSEAGLLGAQAAGAAFTVQTGLGTTMTAQDILDGYMIVQVVLQMVRPAEFIELTFKQRMDGGAATLASLPPVGSPPAV
ncbi:MAG TPA: phage tail sheath C-terminal domain-containing protein [Thermoanaerobaculia bacterium]|nr:phage tail sheath C-terminal domain-containing protein [Thermoanaerobaculia bacterium]